MMTQAYFFVCLTCCPFLALAQRSSPFLPEKRGQVTIESLSGREAAQAGEPQARWYAGNVRVRHQATWLFCDRAAHNPITNQVNAYGHVLLVHNDSITGRCDSLNYEVANQKVTLFGYVVFQNKKRVLTTTRLDYDLLLGVARYTGASRFVDGQRIVTSLRGSYNTQTSQLIPDEPGGLATARTKPRSTAPQPDSGSKTTALTYLGQSPDADYPLRLVLRMEPPQPKIDTVALSAPAYRRATQAVQKSGLTASTVAGQHTDESDLEQLLNQKKRVR